MATQNVGSDQSLAALQAQIAQPFPKQPFFTTPFQRESRYREFQQSKADAITAYMLPLQEELMRAQARGETEKASQLALINKQLQGELAGMNQAGVGLFGEGGGNKMAFLTGRAGQLNDLARAQMANQQSRAVATEMEQMALTPAERLDQAMQAVGYAPGEFTEYMRLQRIGANAEKSQAFDMQASVDSILGQLEGQAGQMAGQPIELFSRQDRQDGIALLQKSLAGGATPDQALSTVLRAAAQRAQSRFMELTAPQAIEAATAPAAAAAPTGPDQLSAESFFGTLLAPGIRRAVGRTPTRDASLEAEAQRYLDLMAPSARAKF